MIENCSGDGISIWGDSGAISKNTIRGNGGNGINLGNSTADVINNLIVNNKQKGMIFPSAGQGKIINNTITGNVGGVTVNNSNAGFQFVNNIIAWNGQDYISPINATYSNLGAGNLTGTGNISKDPVFVDRAKGDYHLQPGSPCIDTGTNTGVPAEDIEGNKRPQDGKGSGQAMADMGCYESSSTSPSANTKPPAVYTEGVSNVSYTSAVINGYLTDKGTASKVEVSFVWGTVSGNYPNETPPQEMDATGLFTYNLANLETGKKYYFQAKAVGDGPAVIADSFYEKSLVPEAPLKGKIAFINQTHQSFYSGTIIVTYIGDIYIVNADGSNRTRLTTTDNNADPALSPDSLKIAFTSIRDGNKEIYTVNTDGTGLKRLTNNSAEDFLPAWSPDGTRLAFVSDRDGNREIYIMNADGSNQVRVTKNSVNNYYPAWSPDGAKLVFLGGEKFKGGGLYTINTDGSNQNLIYPWQGHTWYLGFPDWSVNGKIVFDSLDDGCNIAVINPDGSKISSISDGSVWGIQGCSWSPDGAHIAYSIKNTGSAEGDGFYIYSRWFDGSNRTKITTVPGDVCPSWSIAGEVTPPPVTDNTPPTPDAQGDTVSIENNISITNININNFNYTNNLTVDSHNVTQDGVELTSKDGKAKLDIDKETQCSDSQNKAPETLSVNVPASPPSPPPQMLLAQTYEFGPTEVKFDPAITLVLKYDPNNIPVGTQESDLTLAGWDGAKWVTLESQVDTQAKTVTAKISHFGQYGLLIKSYSIVSISSPAANFALSDFKITPNPIGLNEPVTIQLTISNTGGNSGQYPISIKVNGIEEHKRVVNLPPGKSETVAFQIQRNQPGEYTVEANGNTGRFQVQGPTSESFAIAQAVKNPTNQPGGPSSMPVISTVTAPAPRPEAAIMDKVSLPIFWTLILMVFAGGIAAGMIIPRHRKNSAKQNKNDPPKQDG